MHELTETDDVLSDVLGTTTPSKNQADELFGGASAVEITDAENAMDKFMKVAKARDDANNKFDHMLDDVEESVEGNYGNPLGMDPVRKDEFADQIKNLAWFEDSEQEARLIMRKDTGEVWMKDPGRSDGKMGWFPNPARARQVMKYLEIEEGPASTSRYAAHDQYFGYGAGAMMTSSRGFKYRDPRTQYLAKLNSAFRLRQMAGVTDPELLAKAPLEMAPLAHRTKDLYHLARFEDTLGYALEQKAKSRKARVASAFGFGTDYKAKAFRARTDARHEYRYAALYQGETENVIGDSLWRVPMGPGDLVPIYGGTPGIDTEAKLAGHVASRARGVGTGNLVVRAGRREGQVRTRRSGRGRRDIHIESRRKDTVPREYNEANIDVSLNPDLSGGPGGPYWAPYVMPPDAIAANVYRKEQMPKNTDIIYDRYDSTSDAAARREAGGSRFNRRDVQRGRWHDAVEIRFDRLGGRRQPNGGDSV